MITAEELKKAPFNMLDIHAHLYWKSFNADRAEVINRAREAGVEKIICVAANVEESKLSVALARQYDLKASAGIHPEFFNEEKDFDLSALKESLRRTAEDSSVVAIGECGLQYFSHDPNIVISLPQKARQKQGFEMQINLAKELNLPLIVHTRPSVGSMDAYEDILEIFHDTKYIIRNTVLHCYMGDTEVTQKFLELPNVYFSFTGNITYPPRKEAQGTKYDLGEVVKFIPLERIFTETDCPFLAPQPERGKRNEPAFVRHTFAKVAELKAVPSETLEKALLDNYVRVFER